MRLNGGLWQTMPPEFAHDSRCSSVEEGNLVKTAVSYDNMLLRGCTQRHTDWSVGMAVFTGSYTKLLLNARPRPFKRSTVDRRVDAALYILFAIQAALCTVGAVAQYIWTVRGWDGFEVF